MNILFTRFPLESALGGAEIQTLSLMEGLLERGHAVAFAGSCPVLLKECRERGIPTIERHIGPPPVTAWNAISFWWRKRRMRKELIRIVEGFDEESDELQASSGPQPIAYGSRLTAVCMLSLTEKLLLTKTAHARGIRVCWIEHDRIGRWLTHNPWLPRLRRLSTRAITVPVSRLSGTLYERLGWHAGDIHPIPNGIDERRLTACSRRARRITDSSRLRLGCIARLSPEKGVDVLIRAMRDVPEEVTLEIVGTGPQQDALRQLAQRHGLSKRIAFRAPEQDVRGVYERFDALVLPSSDHDPFGLVAAEAMLLGLPVIVTHRCGIADNLKHGRDALVVQGGSSDALAAAIRQLQNPSVFAILTEHGPKTAHEKFSAKRMVEEYEHLFTIPVPPSR